MRYQFLVMIKPIVTASLKSYQMKLATIVGSLFSTLIVLGVGIMTEHDEVQDPLKLLDQIYEPDERQVSFTASLEDRHAALEEIVLSDTVPLDVRQLFETAKNLSLYSWFVYRFHQVSELISLSSLEMALRERYLVENLIDEKSKKKRPPSLYDLLQHAKKNGWINNEGFSDSYQIARRNAELVKMIEKSITHDFDKEPSMSIDEPSEEEIDEALSKMDRVKAISETSHKIRNDLAHGSNTLHPNSLSTLRINADVINQIYPK